MIDTPCPYDERMIVDAVADLGKREPRCKHCSARTLIGIAECTSAQCPMIGREDLRR